MSSAPGRRELRWFALCAALAGLFNLTNALVTLRVPLETTLLASRINLFVGGLHAAVWLKYSAVEARRPLLRWERVVVTLGVALSCLALVPGLVLESRVFERPVPSLDVTYVDAPPTAFGLFAFAYHMAAVLWVFGRYTYRRARGDRASTAPSIATGALLLGAIHDALALEGVIHGPYLMDLSVLVMVLAVGGSLTSSFVTSARALEVSSRHLSLAHEELVRRERLAALGELSAMVAHEVRNPLAVVFNATAGLRKATPGSSDHLHLTAIIQEEAERLRDMVSDLLDFARPRPPVFAKASLDEVVRSAVDAACAATEAPDRTVLVEAPPELAVTCDERLVRQAIINLVTNALQAPERRGPVKVTVEAAADASCAIAVVDDGRGVPRDQRDRIFTPFYSTRPSGTGLGLAVVRTCAEAHGGAVSVGDTAGGGATFTLRLPRAPAGVG